MDFPIDLRSDTVTKPTPAMKEFMAKAPLGDDVFGEDPTVIELEKETAKLLGHEAAVFMPTGTMSNQSAIRAHTQSGDEMLCESSCHIYTWEAGGPAVLSGVTSRTIPGKAGVLTVDDLTDKIRPLNDHYTRTSIVCLENTHNRGGGRVYPLEEIRKIRAWTKENQLILHLDGARLWNAAVALGVPLATIATEFDSVSVCFSKGLGAPVGSALAGSAAFIRKARRVRKLLGGGMRQAGVIAAGALYAIRNHIGRLAEDHAHAQLLADAVRANPILELDPDCADTNLVWFRLTPGNGTNTALAANLKARGILVSTPAAGLLRACTHLDITAEQAKHVAQVLTAVKGTQGA